MNYNREILEAQMKTNELLEKIIRGMKSWKDADVEAHYNRDKEINHQLSVVLDQMVAFMLQFAPKVSQEQEEDELAEKVNCIAS